MSLFSTLKSIYQTIGNSEGLPPLGDQPDYLRSISEPVDDMGRSYSQYLCQMHLTSGFQRVLYQIGSAALLTLPHRTQPYPAEKIVDAVIPVVVDCTVLPDSLRKEYPGSVHLPEYLEYALFSEKDKAFFCGLRRRYPFAFYFRYKCMLKVGMYRALVEAYHPRAIIVCGEYSFTSSLLTAWCRRNGIEHINVMHGDKTYHIHDSFFHFDRCYVWDDMYRKLFIDLRAEPSQFRVEAPPCVQPWDKGGVEKTVDYTYYLQSEKPEALAAIADALRTLHDRGYTVAVRPHPRYSDKAAVEKLFSFCQIENNTETDIRISVLRTRHAVSAYSTVLYQAYVNGVDVVIDDVSNTAQFRQLQEIRYHMLDVEHQLLSEI